MATKKRPKCRYGAKCYRKDPAHKAGYDHEADDEADQPTRKKTKVVDEDVKQPAKPKLKVNISPL